MNRLELKNVPGIYYQSPGTFTTNIKKAKRMGIITAEVLSRNICSKGFEVIIKPIPIPDDYDQY